MKKKIAIINKHIMVNPLLEFAIRKRLKLAYSSTQTSYRGLEICAAYIEDLA